jgi:hypothetical protein
MKELEEEIKKLEFAIEEIMIEFRLLQFQIKQLREENHILVECLVDMERKRNGKHEA